MVWRGLWDGAWDGLWEGESTPLAPGFIRGAATISIGATGTAGPPSEFIAGAATISISAAGTLTAIGEQPPVEVTPPTPEPGTYGAVGQRTNVHVWREDLSRRMTDRRDPPTRDASDLQDLLDIAQIFDELRLAA